ncbi:MAG: efflux RND transporter periplasmic adaptor subunit [Rikenellaceae bacterium]
MYILLLLFSLVLCSCGGDSASKTVAEPQIPRPVKSIVATSSKLVEKSYAGLSTPGMEVDLAFKVSGQIISIPVATGEEVEAGAVLARIDPRDLELTNAADRSSYEQAKSSYERAVRLLKYEAISKQEVESAESAFTRSKSTYENSLDLLSETTLKAPFRAVVERVVAQEYQRIQAGVTVIRVVSPTTTSVAFTIPENSLSALTDSLTRFSVVFDNYPGERFNAKILEYARSSSDASGFPVTLTIDNPAPSVFYINSGLSCTITMITQERDSDAVVLPLSAIYAPTSGGTYVWVIGSNDRVELRSVELGFPTNQHSIVVKKGVVSGENIVVAGVYQLTNNQVVKIIK